MIQVLDQKTINQIAAGEVVERPSAVVKELMDNSLDAGASAITIEIKEGGISMIRITDNGAGIAKEEIPTAFLRHATSKIRNTEDLLSVTSLGFRGEALSSIAAVAQVELITKRKEDIVGTRYSIEGGKETGCEEVGCPEGTTFVVRNLFYNTPARRKFLKSKTTEGNYIHELVQRYSLAHADIRFSFIVDGKTKFQTSGDGQVKTNIFYHYGREITKELIPICQEQDGMRLEGFIGKPILSRGNRSMMNYFVNGRYIKSPILANATMQGYQGFLMRHRYPFVVLMLSIDSSFIDVNVHPTKMEIRFTNQMEVLSLVRDTVTEALKQSTLIPDVTLDEKEKQSPVEEKPIEKQPEPFEYERKKEWSMRAQPEKKMEEKPFVYESAPFSGKQNVSIVREDYKQLDFKKEEQQEGVVFRIIGQVFGTYWLVEYEKELLIIDQHAAHEKVLYEKLMKKLKDKKPLTQNLIAPIVVSLSGREIEVLEENAQTLTAIGFCWEMFGDREYLITGVPADFLNLEPKQLFLELLDNLRNQNTKSAPEFVIDHCATMACKAAVKGNHTMSYAEAKELIGQMLQMDQPYHCPHGRPTTIAMSQYEFEKKFKRVL